MLTMANKEGIVFKTPMKSVAIKLQENAMAWTAPKIEELTCGMEINMYFPAEDDERETL